MNLFNADIVFVFSFPLIIILMLLFILMMRLMGLFDFNFEDLISGNNRNNVYQMTRYAFDSPSVYTIDAERTSFDFKTSVFENEDLV